jgi:transglutaminase-like putative cysteine protease
MRSGVIFAGASVVLAWILMSVAVAAPLTAVWRNLDGAWITVRDELEGVFGSLSNPNSRISGNSFGPSFTVSGEWVSNDDEALVLTADRPLYLRTATYDEYTGLGFRWSDSDKRPVADGDFLFTGPTSELPTIEEAVVAARIAIEMRQTIGNDLFTAGSPVVIHAPSVVVQTNGAPVLAGMEHETPLSTGEGYELEIALSRATQAELGTAGRDYPPEVSELYLDTTGITDRVAELARDVVEAAGAEDDYERAEALAAYLRLDESFTYATRAEMPGNGQDFVDFFLFDPRADRTGYCEYYASAMALMARSVGLPARVAVGFAPGEPLDEGTYLYRESNAHAWVEIYFPGYGWQIFEATHSIRGVFRASGDPTTVAPPIGTVTDPIDWDRFIEEGGGILPLPSQGEVVGAPTDPGDETDGSSGPGNALLITGLLVAAAVALTLRMRHTRRQWRLLPAGDRAWRQLTAAAERAGIGQRPSETIYEYAGWLEEQLPRHGEPIGVVADGKVWQAYSGRRLTATSNLRLDAALRALRMPMLSLTAKHFLRRLFRPDAKD